MVQPVLEQPSHITLKFVDEGAFAHARLLWDRAPQVCEAFVEATPFRVLAHHAIYSGSEIAAVTPQLPRLVYDGGTSDVEVGDVAYAYILAGEHYGVHEDFSEICWFYDIDARPSMFNGPLQVAVFARVEGAADFFAVSRRMRLEGAQLLEVAVP